METNTRIDVLQDAQDIAVLSRTSDDRCTYGVKLSLDAQEHLYDVSVSDSADREIPAYQRHWQFDRKRGITGSSLHLNLRYDERALRPSNLWLPGLLEGKELDIQRKLENGVHRDFGIVVYSNESSNKDIAGVLISEAEALRLQLPLIVPFRLLNSVANRRMSHGLEFSFVENPQGIIHGEEAEKEIKSLYYGANSGVHRLSRLLGLGNGLGLLGSYFRDLDYSDADGRVDWVCGEATRAELQYANDLLIDRQYSQRIKSLEQEKKKKQEAFQNYLS